MMVSRKHFSRSHPLPLDSSFTPYPSTSSSVMLLLVSQNNLVSHLCISYPAAVLCIYSCPCCIFAQHSVQYIYYTYPVNYILLFSRRPLKLNLFTTHLPSFAAVQLFITVPWTLTWNEMKWKDNREIISWEDRTGQWCLEFINSSHWPRTRRSPPLNKLTNESQYVPFIQSRTAPTDITPRRHGPRPLEEPWSTPRSTTGKWNKLGRLTCKVHILLVRVLQRQRSLDGLGLGALGHRTGCCRRRRTCFLGHS